MAESSKASNKKIAMRRLEEAVKSETGDIIPEPLCDLMYCQRENSDSDMRRYIYRSMFDFLSRERGVGNRCSLVYPQEVLNAIRALYPEGVKDYPPRAAKRRRLYEVTLKELVQQYRTVKRPPSPEY